jgi:hypothetical protein
LITFSKHLQGAYQHVDDLAVEFNDELGNIIAKRTALVIGVIASVKTTVI